MTSKEFLQQAYRLNELIQSDLNELEKLKELTASLAENRAQGCYRAKTGSIVCIQEKIQLLEEQINQEIEEFLSLKQNIRTCITQLRSQNEQLVLRLRYIEFLTWEEVAERISYSIKQAYRIHQSALSHLIVPE